MRVLERDARECVRKRWAVEHRGQNESVSVRGGRLNIGDRTRVCQ
jgi:hypothetical protein